MLLASSRSTCRVCCQLPRRIQQRAVHRPAIFELDGSTVYPFGTPSNDPASADFRHLDWTISDGGSASSPDCWAITGPSTASVNRARLISTVLGERRFDPVDSARWPILEALPMKRRPESEGPPVERQVSDIVKLVSFKTSRATAVGDGFTDYTARYFAIREEDKLTLRRHLESIVPFEEQDNLTLVEETAALLQMDSFLDLPLVTLSNGQTRRARIVRALLSRPEMLVLEEPFTGLDVRSRALLSSLLQSLHESRRPRMMFALRPHDPMPDWVSHLALVGPGRGEVHLGERAKVHSSAATKSLLEATRLENLERDSRRSRRQETPKERPSDAAKVVALQNLNVSYEDRHILKNIDWAIHEGDKWLLAGHNGSGKSTLLSVILGDHPRSYVEDVTLFGRSRDRQATATLQANIGHVSPEIFNAFPRRFGSEGLTAREAIATGFESVFSYRRLNEQQRGELEQLLRDFDHPALTPPLLDKLFAELQPGDQMLVLLLRALIKKPPLLVLDEPYSGMSRETIDKVNAFIEHKLDPRQAVIIITHFEEELPSCIDRGLRLEDGAVAQQW